MYFGLMKKYKEQYGVKVYAYNLMPSHLHLLMEVDEKTTISTVMHNINSTYTKFYNGRYARKGHLFRERFKAALIENDPKVLLNLTAYMHLNAKKMEVAIQAQTLRYNSYSLYLDYDQQNDRGLDMKNEINGILSGLIGENYSQYLQKAEQSMDFKKMHKQLQRKGMFGSPAFMESVKKKIDEFREPTAAKKETAELKPVVSKSNEKITKKSFNPAGIAILILILSSAGIYIYFDYSAKAPVEVAQKVIIKEVNKEELENLDETEWQIKLTSSDGKAVKKDTVFFVKGKFASKYLTQLNYSMSNYSMFGENDKIIWETMQTSYNGIALWRGEITGDKMNGILSLQQKGKQQQVFSFKSITHRKKMGGLK